MPKTRIKTGYRPKLSGYVKKEEEKQPHYKKGARKRRMIPENTNIKLIGTGLHRKRRTQRGPAFL
jgi:hypothetical protein